MKLFMYDYTGIMAQPWLDAGYECCLVDGQHPSGLNRHPEHPLLLTLGCWVDAYNHRTQFMRMMQAMLPDVDFIMGFPECTDLAVSGAAHFAKKRAIDAFFQDKAVANATLIATLGNAYGCPWAFENPVSVISTLYRKPDFWFNPSDYGGWLQEHEAKHPLYPDYIADYDAYPKKTGIWCGNGFKEPVKRPVEVAPGYSTQHLKLGGKSRKTKNIRSATPRGFARAVYEANQC